MKASIQHIVKRNGDNGALVIEPRVEQHGAPRIQEGWCRQWDDAPHSTNQTSPPHVITHVLRHPQSHSQPAQTHQGRNASAQDETYAVSCEGNSARHTAVRKLLGTRSGMRTQGTSPGAKVMRWRGGDHGENQHSKGR